MSIVLDWVHLGHMAYDPALEIQLTRAKALQTMADDRQTVFAVEHPPTITIGRNGTTDNILADEAVLEAEGFDVRHVDRGGDVTYHGPGQLVLYPVLHLEPWKNDVKRYVYNLEEVVIAALKTVGLTGERESEYPGVWTHDAKICAVGARVQKRPTGEFVTYHGIALNLNTNLAHFQNIVPCGIVDKDVTSLEKELGHRVDFEEWEHIMQTSFSKVFGAVLVDATV